MGVGRVGEEGRGALIPYEKGAVENPRLDKPWGKLYPPRFSQGAGRSMLARPKNNSDERQVGAALGFEVS